MTVKVTTILDSTKQKDLGTALSPHTVQFLGGEWGILKSCPRVPKLGMIPQITKTSALWDTEAAMDKYFIGSLDK